MGITRYSVFSLSFSFSFLSFLFPFTCQSILFFPIADHLSILVYIMAANNSLTWHMHEREARLLFPKFCLKSTSEES